MKNYKIKIRVHANNGVLTSLFVEDAKCNPVYWTISPGHYRIPFTEKVEMAIVEMRSLFDLKVLEIKEESVYRGPFSGSIIEEETLTVFLEEDKLVYLYGRGYRGQDINCFIGKSLENLVKAQNLGVRGHYGDGGDGVFLEKTPHILDRPVNKFDNSFMGVCLNPS